MTHCQRSASRGWHISAVMRATNAAAPWWTVYWLASGWAAAGWGRDPVRLWGLRVTGAAIDFFVSFEAVVSVLWATESYR